MKYAKIYHFIWTIELLEKIQILTWKGIMYVYLIIFFSFIFYFTIFKCPSKNTCWGSSYILYESFVIPSKISKKWSSLFSHTKFEILHFSIFHHSLNWITFMRNTNFSTHFIFYIQWIRRSRLFFLYFQHSLLLFSLTTPILHSSIFTFVYYSLYSL